MAAPQFFTELNSFVCLPNNAAMWWYCVIYNSPVTIDRFGKVLWRSDGRHSVSDEVLEERHKIEDLERGGKVSVKDVLGGSDTKWCFQTM